MAKRRFFICRHCGNIVGLINDSGAPISCCGDKMEELAANTVDAAKEKHVPAVAVDGNIVNVTVGSVEHPMLPAHYIQWIYLETTHGGQRKALLPSEKPQASFALADGEKPVAVYEYCNLHGLWMTEIR